MRLWTATAAALIAATVCSHGEASAQEIHGQIVDTQNGGPVGLAAVILLDTDRKPVAGS